jgi:hypothetical protein
LLPLISHSICQAGTICETGETGEDAVVAAVSGSIIDETVTSSATTEEFWVAAEFQFCSIEDRCSASEQI